MHTQSIVLVMRRKSEMRRVETVLRTAGYGRIETFTSVQEAVAHLSSSLVQILLSDLLLKDGTAVDLFKHCDPSKTGMIVFLDGTGPEPASLTCIPKTGRAWTNLGETVTKAVRQLRPELKIPKAYDLVSSPVPTLGLSEDGTVNWFNQAAEELTGFGRLEIRTVQEWLERLHPDPVSRKEAERRLGALLFGDSTVNSEFTITDRNGKIRFVELKISPIADGSMVQILEKTAHHQAEEAAILRQNLLLTLIDALPDPIYVKDCDGRFIIANEATIRVLGCGTAQEVLGKTDFDFLPEKKARELREDERKLIRSKKDIITTEVYSLDGNRCALVSKILFRNKEGKAEYIIGINRDITSIKQSEFSLIATTELLEHQAELRNTQLRRINEELRAEIRNREETEKELRDSRLIYKTTIDSMEEALHVIDRNYTLLLVNRPLNRWLKELHVSPMHEGMDMFKAQQFLPQRIREEYEWVFKTGKNMVTQENTEVAGETIYTETRKIPIKKEGEVFRIITMVRNITESHLQQEEIRSIKERLETVMDNVPEVIYQCLDKLGTTTFITPQWAEWTGFGPEDFYKDPKIWIKSVHPDDRREAAEAYTSACKAGLPYLLQYRLKHRRTGEIRHVLDHGIPRQTEQGLIYEGIITDITKQRLIEDQLRHSLQEKEVLLKEIHHRVKNNLQIISSLLGLQAKSLDEDRIVSMFQESQNRIRSMALLHEKLYQSDLSSIDMAGYIKSMTDDLLHIYKIDTRRVHLEIKVDPAPLPIDTALSCGLITNELISNALKHAFPSPKKKGRLEISLKKCDGTAELIVEDDGPGFPADLDFRKTSSLGMSLVVLLAEKQLEGTVELERKNGTRFIIRFPLKSNDPSMQGSRTRT